tara:strand:+ start:632 stop:826 length:195 start_codon:yes stop_codon:yes gene_type:complete
MDYHNKKKFAKKKAKQRKRDAVMRKRREALQIEKTQEKMNSKIVYKYRERLTPYRKPKIDSTEG